MALSSFLKKAKKLQDEMQAQHEQGPKHTQGGHDEGNWLIAYADMMTLLCGFFIMMFALAAINSEQRQKTKEEIAKHFGGQVPDSKIVDPPKDPDPSASLQKENPVEELKKYFSKILLDAGIEQEATIRMEPNGISVAFESTLFFDTLSAYIKDQGRSVLDKLITALLKRQNDEKKLFNVVVEGHTDGRLILSGVYPSNWELSSARAARVVRLFIEQGLSPEKTLAIGYADTRPRLPHRLPNGSWNEKALVSNRRVVVRILEGSPEVLKASNEGDAVQPEVPVNAVTGVQQSVLPNPQTKPNERTPATNQNIPKLETHSAFEAKPAH
jgi:chemotaxis protein MotB